MNDTKWREVFEVFAQCDDGEVQLRLKTLYLPEPSSLFGIGSATHVTGPWVDTLAYGPMEFADVDWIEVSGEGAAGLRQRLSALGQLPLVDAEGGFRIVGYGM